MGRTTRRDVEKAVELLARIIDLDKMAERYGPGALALDHYNPGDNPYAYKVVWVNKDNGGHNEPFGSLRCTGRELIDRIHFMWNAVAGGVVISEKYYR